MANKIYNLWEIREFHRNSEVDSFLIINNYAVFAAVQFFFSSNNHKWDSNRDYRRACVVGSETPVTTGYSLALVFSWPARELKSTWVATFQAYSITPPNRDISKLPISLRSEMTERSRRLSGGYLRSCIKFSSRDDGLAIAEMPHTVLLFKNVVHAYLFLVSVCDWREHKQFLTSHMRAEIVN